MRAGDGGVGWLTLGSKDESVRWSMHGFLSRDMPRHSKGVLLSRLMVDQ